MKKEKTIPISIRISESMLEILKSKSREMSYKKSKDISYIDLIRQAIEKEYIEKR